MSEYTTNYTATYSPEDNKLRLYSVSRLPQDLYSEVKAHGFIWAAKQELFVAPAWSPGREDFLVELCGEIGDEDTSLVDRAEQRADRFEDYSDKRARDAESARQYVSSIADNIPFGQPILVGHHSERHARKDAERIENGMRRAVKMWETSGYWKERAAGAVRAAKYKELPGVRARRIKGLEADKRRKERTKKEAENFLKLWNRPGLTLEQARAVANVCWLKVKGDGADYWTASDVLQPDGERYQACPAWTVEQVQESANRAYPKTIAHCERWIQHLDNRLTYEKAMLEDQGATDLLKPKARPAQLPLCNYRQDPFTVPNKYRRGEFLTYPQVEMTSKEYADIYRDYKGTDVVDGTHRIRVSIKNRARVAVFLTDSKVHPKPEPAEQKPAKVEEPTPTARPVSAYTAPEPTVFDAMKDTLKAGVQVVSAPQLFPTPTDLVERMIEEAAIESEHNVLEPSAGTGNLAKAIREAGADPVCCEINHNLARLLSDQGYRVVSGDFIERFSLFDPKDDVGEVSPQMKQWDRIVMNPPFQNGQDIKHIQHARKLLKPGGRLVALCANGPRQREALQPIANYWEDLPAGSFAAQGTNVNVALLVIEN